MIRLRCECGSARIALEDGAWPQDCEGCDHCDVTFAEFMGTHKPRIAHDLKPQFNPDTGLVDTFVCKRCGNSFPAEIDT